MNINLIEGPLFLCMLYKIWQVGLLKIFQINQSRFQKFEIYNPVGFWSREGLFFGRTDRYHVKFPKFHILSKVPILEKKDFSMNLLLNILVCSEQF